MKVVVYGAGNNCRLVLEHLKDECLCIADRDEKKWGKIINGYLVVSPNDMLGREYDRVIVSILYGFSTIKDELVRLGVPEEKILNWTEVIRISPRNTGSVSIDWGNGLLIDDIFGEICKNEGQMNEMEKYFYLGKHRRSFKWLHYFEAYNRHFGHLIGKDVNIMEIGVQKGGSMQLWKKVFGPKSKIYGVDIQEACRRFEDDRVKIFIGDQEDREFWKSIKKKIPKLDIIIDDGGHYMNQQIVTFEEMFPHVKEGGFFICEDICTSYNVDKYNAGIKKKGTFVEYSKDFIDYIHAWYPQGSDMEVNEYTRTIHSLHYYYGMLVIEKKCMYPPFDMEIDSENQLSVLYHLRGNLD